MSFQLLSSTADKSSVLQLYLAGLLRLCLLLNCSGSKSKTDYFFCDLLGEAIVTPQYKVVLTSSTAQIQAFNPQQRQHESFSFFTLTLLIQF